MPTSDEILRGALRPQRWARIQSVLAQRLASVRLVLENVHHPHNVSAVLRSCEAFGVQHVHAVETSTNFRFSRRITMGTHKWLTLSRHDCFDDCATQLRAEGFKLYAAVPDLGAVPLEQLPVDEPVALVLGNEKAGLTPCARALCDGCYTIPMAGFAQSLNISVAASVSLYDVTRRARAARRDGGLLTSVERSELLATWLPKTVPCGKKVMRASAGADRAAKEAGGCGVDAEPA